MKALRWLLLVPIVGTPAVKQPYLGTRGVPIIEEGRLRFKDLDRNGELDPYEDWRLSPEERARDLVRRMSLVEKAGAMMHGTARAAGPMGPAGFGSSYDSAANRALIDSGKVTAMITRLNASAGTIAAQNNMLQEIAEHRRLGIPLLLSTDPRNHVQNIRGVSTGGSVFSVWPDPAGLAATRDTSLVRKLGDIARREYRAVGIQMALSPQADVATEPRWPRVSGTFGEDADLARGMVRAYVTGLQHGMRGLDSTSAAAVVMHWVGEGAARDGLDSQDYDGRYASFAPSKGSTNLEYHVRPFLGAFAAHVAGVMPAYSILQDATWGGQPIEQVGAGFNKQLLTDVLRGKYAFRGVVLADWAITNDCNARCVRGAAAGERPSAANIGAPWGMENVPMRARFVKAVRAGVDQFGGTERANMLVDAVEAGELAPAQIDSAVARVLTQRFALGLFENPYVDTAAASRVVGSAAFRAAGRDAQRRSLVLLENKGAILPLRGTGHRVFLRGIDPSAVAHDGWLAVSDPAQADVAIMRIGAPYQTSQTQYRTGAQLHEGSLAFTDSTPGFAEFVRVSAKVPTIAVVHLDRPAILTPIQQGARAVIGEFGVTDEALIDVLSGRRRPSGKLPFELPASMDAVLRQRSDVARDIAQPLYPFGYGLTYR